MEVRLNKLISDSGLCSRREADKFIEMGRVTVNGQQPEPGKKVDDTDIILVDDNRIRVGKGAEKESLRAVSGKAKNLIFGSDGKKKPEGSFNVADAHKADSPRKVDTRKTDAFRKEAPRKETTRKSDTQYKSEASPKFGATRKGEAPRKDEVTYTSTEGNRHTAGTGKDELRRTNAPYKKSARNVFPAGAETFDETKGGNKRAKYGTYNKYAAARKAGTANSGESKSRRDAKEASEYAQAMKDARNPKFGKSLSRSAVAQRIAAAPKSAALRKTSKNNPVNRAKYTSNRNKAKGE
ncbi:MAG: S4 domain-containing protein [Tannerellaceae bacterium]